MRRSSVSQVILDTLYGKAMAFLFPNLFLKKKKKMINRDIIKIAVRQVRKMYYIDTDTPII